MERHPPVLEKLTAQISTLLEKYTLLQEELKQLTEEKNALMQTLEERNQMLEETVRALEEKNAENKALYNEISLKEREIEGIVGQIQTVLDPNNAGGGSTTTGF